MIVQKNIHIIINLRAGLLNARFQPRDVADQLRSALPDAVFHETGDESQATAVLRAAARDGVPRVIVVGGDGTAHHAARLLAGSRTELALIPLGSANNIARSLNIPQTPPEALRLAVDGVARHIDVGRCGRQMFLEAAGIGYHASVLALYDRRDHKSLVRGAYAIVRTALALAPFPATLTADGRLMRRNVFQLTISNLPMYGTNFRPSPDALPDDGLLDVTLVTRARPLDLLPGVIAARAGVLQKLPGVETFRCRTLRIETSQPMPLHCDADARLSTPMTISVDPAALRIVRP
jgi:diacylglycerol kinase (ATP)